MKLEQTYKTVRGEEATEILKNANGEPIVITFSTEWTGSGQMLDNFYKELTREYENAVYFLRVDVEKSEEYVKTLGITKVPTTLIFRDRDMVDSFEGLLPKDMIKEKIDKALEK
ncbi:MAG: thioredoxin family protein [Bacteroidota bacterium]